MPEPRGSRLSAAVPPRSALGSLAEEARPFRVRFPLSAMRARRAAGFQPRFAFRREKEIVRFALEFFRASGESGIAQNRGHTLRQASSENRCADFYQWANPEMASPFSRVIEVLPPSWAHKEPRLE